MISFAPLFYSKLINNKEIIYDISYYDVTLIDGVKLFESQVTLNSNLRCNFDKSEIYSDVDGGGTSKYKNIAIYKSLSEALERWAFYDNVNSTSGRVQFGFDINPTTTGMAAFPSLTIKCSRALAYNEAVERFILDCFNHGIGKYVEHKTEINGLRHFELLTPFENHYVSILNYNSGSRNYYGFSSGKSIKDSFSHSLIELSRNIRVLEKISNNFNYEKLNNINDKRLIYFSKDEGNIEFLEKFLKLSNTIPFRPEIKIDSEIKGEWSKYTKVYRILFEQKHKENFDQLNYFLF